ncbi:MAG TPA: pyridoxamine 5'-phosphate oxidase family protein [Saprospiraceae bacterium]|nr:pyridoxamine 5'-phosphate oxidase family protein [Saprospiraceae bacterium]HMQ82046.1 pyridoxamine 5'-phosphate oxidase family protein [Saprospiraceae bacterium]
MGKQFSAITAAQQHFIEQQKLFFVATAAPEGRINLSPKGLDALKVIDENKVIWLNLTGSGNETAAHLLENNRMTLMFCSFEKNPLILRLYGRAKCHQHQDAAWKQWIDHFPSLPGARQIFELQVDLVQTSCGFGIPLYEYIGERDTLVSWAEKKGEAGIESYWAEKNKVSLDGKPTGIL